MFVSISDRDIKKMKYLPFFFYTFFSMYNTPYPNLIAFINKSGIAWNIYVCSSDTD